MADNFGLKIGVEGEKEFKKALSEINGTMKVLGSEMKLVESSFDKQDKSVQVLTSRNEVLIIPFIVDGKHIYLPFMALYLQERGDGEKQDTSRMLPSAQLLLLFYIYHGCGELSTSDATQKLELKQLGIRGKTKDSIVNQLIK